MCERARNPFWISSSCGGNATDAIPCAIDESRCLFNEVYKTAIFVAEYLSNLHSSQALYERICEYLELDTRAEVLNARFQVLQEMLDMLRDHKNNSHAARLEWIIIWLLMVDVILMLFQLLSLFGLV